MSPHQVGAEVEHARIVRGLLDNAADVIDPREPMASSAMACLIDGENQYATGAYVPAARWALRAFAYAVGEYHPTARLARSIAETHFGKAAMFR